jgi:long-chain acyl-CoA synthetase
MGADVCGFVPFRFDPAPEAWLRPGDFLGQLTSGVDRPSKLAIRTHAAVWNEIQDFAAEIGVTGCDATLVLSSISHSYGLIGGTLAPLCHGGRVILRDHPRPEEVPQLVARERATILYAVPVTYRTMVGGALDGQPDLSSLRLCFSAGAALPRGTDDGFAERFGRRISQNYGTTEAGVISTRLAGDSSAQGSVGRPVRNRIVQITDSHGRPLGPGQIGEVVVRSPALARIYLERPQGVPAPIGESLATGDLGWMSEQGDLFLAGRTSSMIHLAGLTIDPLEVEEVIGRLPQVRDVAVVGVLHAGVARLTAILVAEGIAAPDVVRHCSRYLPEAKVPTSVEFRAALPRTAAGKIIRRALA